MTIAAKLRAFTLLILLVSIAFGYSFWKTSAQLKNQRNVNNLIQSIIKNTFEFSIITNEYITNRSPRIQTQWSNSNASMEKLFVQAANKLRFTDDKSSLKKIIVNKSQAEEFINGLIVKDIVENTTKHAPSDTQRRKKIQSISQIHVRVQGMLSQASKMSRRSLDRLTTAENELEYTSALLILIYFSFFIVAFFLTRKNILNPIVRLQKNAEQLALGEYDSRIPVTGKDEISAMAESYNILATEIQKKIKNITERSEQLSNSRKKLLSFNNNLQDMIDKQTINLKNSANKQRIILESMADGIVTLDSEFVIQDINPAITKIFGYSADSCIHKKITFIVSNLRDVKKNSDIFYEKDGLHKNGKRFPVELTLNSMTINDSMMYSCVIRDITERKHVQKMQVEFVSNVSHELRTPLTSIKGALGLVNSGVLVDAPEIAQELLTTAYGNTERLTLLINDLLDMQKIEAGKLDFSISKINLMDAIEQSINDNINYAKQFNVDIQAINPLKNIFVKSDPLRLSQIMSNLLSNAAKFSFQGSVIYIKTSLEDPFVRLSVIDSGEGIPEEYFDQIFDKFTQSDSSATRQKGGTGLGLAITKQMIETMGGSINFTSVLGKGTTFNIYLPIDK